MKKLSLLILAILSLGCGTETTVVEEPEPLIEEPEPVVMEEEPIPGPQIVGGNVLDGDVDTDPELLNRDGIIIEFTEPLSMYYVVFGCVLPVSSPIGPLAISSMTGTSETKSI